MSFRLCPISLSALEYSDKIIKVKRVGTRDILKFILYRNLYYNGKNIYWKFIHVKNIPCHISGMTLGLSRLGEIWGIARIASGNHFYRII